MAWRRRKDPEPDQTEIQRIIDHDVRLAAHLSLPDRDRLIERTTEVIALAHWESIAGLVLTNEVRVTVAANAAIPVLALGTHVYRQVRAVIVRPTTAVMGGQRTGPAGGTMTDDPMLTSGVAFAETGPIAISWDVALRESRHPWAGRNLVIHEFAHKIDMSDGYTDGTPPLRGAELTRWTAILANEFDGGDDQADEPDGAEEPTRPVLDSYAWANPAEFFAVASEAFFCVPARLRNGKPRVYEALRDFYRQDPAHDRAVVGGTEPTQY